MRIIVLLYLLVLTKLLVYFIPAAANRSKHTFAASIPSRVVVQDKEDSSEDETWNIDNATKISTLEDSLDEVHNNDKVYTDKQVYSNEEDLSTAGHYSVDLEYESEEEDLIPDF